jgi:hypothetical protein
MTGLPGSTTARSYWTLHGNGYTPQEHVDCRTRDLRKTTGRRYTRGTGDFTCPRGQLFQSHRQAARFFISFPGPPKKIYLASKHFPVRNAYGIVAGTSFESVLFPAELTAVTT